MSRRCRPTRTRHDGGTPEHPHPGAPAINATQRRALLGALLLIAVLAALGLNALDLPAGSADPPRPSAAPGGRLPSPPPVGESGEQLASLVVARAGSMRGYDRDRFPHWSSRGDNCTTRELVLKRDGTDVAVDDSCAPVRGRWYSLYDERWLDRPQEIDIDHVVPLANAWRSGADEWTDEEREAFANDVDRGQLIAVSAGSNRAKGDQDPSQWRPSNTGIWCDYARWWIDVKHQYQLTVTDAEKSALTDMLGNC